MTVAVRGAAVLLACTEYASDCEPVPDMGLIVSHPEAFDESDHCVVGKTLANCTVPAAAAGVARATVAGLNDSPLPDCVTVNATAEKLLGDAGPIVIVPVRDELLTFGSTRKFTFAVPVPPGGTDVTLNQVSADAAVQLTPAVAFTVNVSSVPADPAAPKLFVAGATVGALAPASLIVNSTAVNVVAPAGLILILPLRADAVPFASAEKLTVPVPVPVAPLVTLIQESAARISVCHWADVDVGSTLTVPVPPPALKEIEAGLSTTETGTVLSIAITRPPSRIYSRLGTC